MENTLEIEPEIDITLKPHQCPKCGFVNNVEVVEIKRYADSGVMHGKPYQVVEVITTVCQSCGTQYATKNYY
jgi:predicted Zn-ribbon and HTH transcriptional regulator